MEIKQTDIACERQEPLERRVPPRGSRPGDRPLDSEREPPLGAHLVTPRLGYTHHGIYVGGGSVVQYGGFSWGLRPGPVEEVSLPEFCQGRQVWVRLVGSTWFDPHEVVRRARQRIGEDLYSVLTNNCEHFCEWCVRGQPRSYQIESRIAGHRGTLLKLVEWLASSRSRRRAPAAVDRLYPGHRCWRAID